MIILTRLWEAGSGAGQAPVQGDEGVPGRPQQRGIMSAAILFQIRHLVQGAAAQQRRAAGAAGRPGAGAGRQTAAARAGGG